MPMSAFEILNHLLNFLAPALFVALVLALGAQACFPKRTRLRPWYLAAAIHTLLGVVWLLLGLVLTGQDGRLVTYAGLILVTATSQAVMLRGRSAA